MELGRVSTVTWVLSSLTSRIYNESFMGGFPISLNVSDQWVTDYRWAQTCMRGFTCWNYFLFTRTTREDYDRILEIAICCTFMVTFIWKMVYKILEHCFKNSFMKPSDFQTTVNYLIFSINRIVNHTSLPSIF